MITAPQKLAKDAEQQQQQCVRTLLPMSLRSSMRSPFSSNAMLPLSSAAAPGAAAADTEHFLNDD
jgi:hypothetical protein